MQVISRLLMSTGCALLALTPIQATLAAPAEVDSDAVTSVQLAQNERPKVTVLPLSHGDVSSDYWWYSSYYRGQGAARGISELLISELVSDGAYSVVDSSQVIESDNNIDENAAIDRAQAMNLDAVIAGTITQFDLQEDQQCVSVPFVGRTCTNETKAIVQVNVRLIDPVTREIIATAEGEGDASKSGGSIDLRRGPDASSSDRRAADELLTEATEEAIEQIVPGIVSAEDRF